MIPISFEKLWQYVHHGENKSRFRGDLEETYKDILKAFEFSYRREDNYRQTFREYALIQKREELLRPERWSDLLSALRTKPLDLRKFLRALVPDTYSVDQGLIDELIGNAQEGEIEICNWGENLLKIDSHGIPASLFEIFVDDVKFLHYLEKESHTIDVREGKYIRIKPPPNISGGVALGIDDESGDVVLVSQFRHAPHRFLTEAPRGFFSVGEDEDPVEAAVRELNEETGFHPVEPPIVLKYSFTDTGAMSFRPVLCLIFVDKNRPTPTPKLDAAMAVPIWVRLIKFYEAVFNNGSVGLSERDFDEITYFDDRDTSNWRVPSNSHRLEICDNFTICAATLALPYLASRYESLRKFAGIRLLGQ